MKNKVMAGPKGNGPALSQGSIAKKMAHVKC